LNEPAQVKGERFAQGPERLRCGMVDNSLKPAGPVGDEPVSRRRPARSGPSSSRLSRKRRWVYRLLAVILAPLVVLSALEGALRLFGYGWPTTFTLTQEFNGRECYVRNPDFTRRFFPPGITRRPAPFAYPVTKDADVFRIFVLGGSAAAGDPEAAYGFARILRVMLRDRYPQMPLEVINTSATAINSHAVREIALHCADHQGDLFIVYLGNNEVVGAFGAGNTALPTWRSLSLIRARLWLGTTRIGQLIGNLSSGGSKPKRWRGMEMFLDQQVRADDPDLQRVYRHFRANLEDICDALASSGSPVVLSTVAVNLRDCAPLASLHRRDLTETDQSAWESLYEEGVAHESPGRLGQAIGRYMEAEKLDAEYADLHYRLGRCYARLGQYDRAKAEYIKARDFDTLRFRADTRINQVIREVAASRGDRGVCLVDAAAVLAEDSPHGIPGHELFYEHVHPNFAGNYALARAVFGEVERALAASARGEAGDRPLPSRDQCARRLGFTSYDRWKTLGEVLRRLGRPPFTGQLDIREQTARTQKLADDLLPVQSGPTVQEGEKIYREAVSDDPADPVLRGKFGLYLLLVSRKPEAAVVQLRQALSRGLDDDGTWRVNLGGALAQAGQGDEAEKCLRETLAVWPEHPLAHSNLAVLLQGRGEIPEAIEHYEAAIAVEPATARVCELAWLLATHPHPGIRNRDRAVALAEAAARATDNREAKVLDVLAAAYAQAGRFSTAVSTARRALELLGADQTKLKAEIEGRLKCYQAKRPFRQGQ